MLWWKQTYSTEYLTSNTDGTPWGFNKAIVKQDHLLGRHQQGLAGVTQSLESLAEQPSEQQAQLVQLVASIKDLTTQLQNLRAAKQVERDRKSVV